MCVKGPTTLPYAKATGVRNDRKIWFCRTLMNPTVSRSFTCCQGIQLLSSIQGRLRLTSPPRPQVCLSALSSWSSSCVHRLGSLFGQSIQVHVARKRSLRAGCGTPSAACTYPVSRFGPRPKGRELYGVLRQAADHPPATKLG